MAGATAAALQMWTQAPAQVDPRALLPPPVAGSASMTPDAGISTVATSGKRSETAALTASSAAPAEPGAAATPPAGTPERWLRGTREPDSQGPRVRQVVAVRPAAVIVSADIHVGMAIVGLAHDAEARRRTRKERRTRRRFA